jgi:hypothetical protein
MVSPSIYRRGMATTMEGRPSGRSEIPPQSGARHGACRPTQRLGETALPTTLTGDGANSLVEAWPARKSTGTITTLLWNGTLA